MLRGELERRHSKRNNFKIFRWTEIRTGQGKTVTLREICPIPFASARLPFTSSLLRFFFFLFPSSFFLSNDRVLPAGDIISLPFFGNPW